MADVHDDASAKPTDETLANDFKKTNSLLEKGQNLIDFISNPTAFLQKNLNPANPLAKALFSNEDKSLNVDLGQEVYRFANDYALLGLRSTQNPLLKAFQQAWLNQLGHAMKGVLDQTNEVERQMAAIKVDSQSGTIVTSKRRPTSLTREPEPDCSVFDNDASSRALMKRDQNLWLRLYETCAPKK